MTLGLHIEPTSRCTLACPRCERTYFQNKFKKKNFSIVDLDIQALENFIDCDLDHVHLCGNLGDPIYHRQFIDLVTMLVDKTKSITITTNGTGKNKQWWSTLNSVLRSSDVVQFSIDGTPDNFTQYRINANWDSIKVGIEQCVAGSVKTIWKYIPFSFNEHSIEQAQQLSQQLGIDKFRLDPSDRWWIDDPLRPSDEHIGPRDTLQQQYKTTGEKHFDIVPACDNNEEHYINAKGYYSACCHSANYEFYYRSTWWLNNHQHCIQDSKLSDQIRHFDKFRSTIHTSRPDYCVFNCGRCE